MKRRTLTLGSLEVDVPSTWCDITGELEADEPPFTLADTATNIGALQFSVARYEAGVVPTPTPETLLAMAQELGACHDLTAPHNCVIENGVLLLGAVSYRASDDFIRIWYVSDGRSFAKATYTCQWGLELTELAACEEIVRSARFL